ncbi:DUF255 domain-containing protein [Nibribacter ruber]|uniref:DUF255 domain-containing protein n=1 Tax=Nibribacter ruber TaxID=2698458 RepID=A0A6P1NVI3_9BACT|nr:DUF255 domain-containing protein [Nibribacter ruber]QHL86279.1 DUF255 domain-containing protein [Nibribacter ruber]
MLFLYVLFTSWLWTAPVAASLSTPSVKVSAPAAAVQWLTLEQALAKSKTKPKKILIDVYTDWCGWCKKMDKQVYQDPAVAAKLNKEFYVVKLNAEQRQPVTINGRTYKYLEKYKAHELALSLLNGQMSYPSTVFLNEKQQVMQRVPGFYAAKDFMQLLTHISIN